MSAPLSPDPWLDELLASERAAPPPPAGAQARVWARLEASVAAEALTGSEAFGAARTSPHLSRPARAPAPTQLPPGLGLWTAAPLVFGALLVGAVAQWGGANTRPDAAHVAGPESPVMADDEAPPASTAGEVMAGEVMADKVTAALPTAPLAAAHAAVVDTPEVDRPAADVPAAHVPAAGVPAAGVPVADLPPVGVPATGEPTAESGEPTAAGAQRRADAARRRAQRPRRRLATQARAQAAPEVSSLRRELALVRQARAALAAKDPAAALATLQRHRTRFPNGELSEERAALRVVALAASGARSAAAGAGRAFQRRYPGSLHAGVVQAALAGSSGGAGHGRP